MPGSVGPERYTDGMLERERDGLVEAGESQGLVTRAEAMKVLTKRQIHTRVASGAWVRVFPSVYRVVGAPVTWRQRLEALLLWAGKGAALSHRTAAILHGFSEFKGEPLDLTAIRRMRVPNGVRLYRVKALPHGDLTSVDDLSVTSVTRTLIDLGARSDAQTLRATFSQALREKETTLPKLGVAVGRSENRRGVIEVRSLVCELEGGGGPTESELEDRALTTIAEGGLPRPKVQWVVVVGRKVRRLDLIFQNAGVVVETDGYAYHSGIETFEDDRERNNNLTISGLLVLHWTWQALLERPEELIAQLYVALNLRREH